MSSKIILAVIAISLAVFAIVINVIFYRRSLSDLKERQTHLDNLTSNLDMLQEALNELEEIECLLCNEHNLETLQEANNMLKKLSESLANGKVESNSRNSDTDNRNNKR